jgi:hypothetical protein
MKVVGAAAVMFLSMYTNVLQYMIQWIHIKDTVKISLQCVMCISYQIMIFLCEQRDMSLSSRKKLAQLLELPLSALR